MKGEFYDAHGTFLQDWQVTRLSFECERLAVLPVPTNSKRSRKSTKKPDLVVLSKYFLLRT